MDRSTFILPAAIIPARSTTSAISACSPAACRHPTDGDTVEGYHLLVGGGFGPDAVLARDIYRDVKAEDVPQTVERVLKAYVAHRASPQETFLTFTRRHEADALKTLFDAQVSP